MPPKRGGLGRGLDALIGRPATPSVADGQAPATLPAASPATEHVAGDSRNTAAGPGDDGALLLVELGRIERNPRQPRRQMDETQLGELADSIREHGLLQPVVVTRLDQGASEGPPRYRLIAGERRWQAAKIAGLVRIPVLVRDVTPRELLELALVENVQRADLNAVEAALAYQQLAQDFGLTQEQIGRRVGKSRFAIANTLRLLQLPAAVQQAIAEAQISEGHARAILGLADPDAQRQLALKVVEDGLSVRQTEELVRRLQVPTTASGKSGRPPAPDVAALEERFRDVLRTKVSLTRTKRGGRLTIFYDYEEQLQELYDRLATD